MDNAIKTRLWSDVPTEDTAPRPRVAADWPLMGDIVSHRMEIPEHLIRWRAHEARREDGDEGRAG